MKTTPPTLSEDPEERHFERCVEEVLDSPEGQALLRKLARSYRKRAFPEAIDITNNGNSADLSDGQAYLKKKLEDPEFRTAWEAEQKRTADPLEEMNADAVESLSDDFLKIAYIQLKLSYPDEDCNRIGKMLLKTLHEADDDEFMDIPRLIEKMQRAIEAHRSQNTNFRQVSVNIPKRLNETKVLPAFVQEAVAVVLYRMEKVGLNEVQEMTGRSRREIEEEFYRSLGETTMDGAVINTDTGEPERLVVDDLPIIKEYFSRFQIGKHMFYQVWHAVEVGNFISPFYTSSEEAVQFADENGLTDLHGSFRFDYWKKAAEGTSLDANVSEVELARVSQILNAMNQGVALNIEETRIIEHLTVFMEGFLGINDDVLGDEVEYPEVSDKQMESWVKKLELRQNERYLDKNEEDRWTASKILNNSKSFVLDSSLHENETDLSLAREIKLVGLYLEALIKLTRNELEKQKLPNIFPDNFFVSQKSEKKETTTSEAEWNRLTQFIPEKENLSVDDVVFILAKYWEIDEDKVCKLIPELEKYSGHLALAQPSRSFDGFFFVMGNNGGKNDWEVAPYDVRRLIASSD